MKLKFPKNELSFETNLENNCELFWTKKYLNLWIVLLVRHAEVERITNWFLRVIAFDNYITSQWIEVIWSSCFVIFDELDGHIEHEWFSSSYCNVILNILWDEFMFFDTVRSWVDNAIYIKYQIGIWNIGNFDFEIDIKSIVTTPFLFDSNIYSLALWLLSLYEVSHQSSNFRRKHLHRS